MENKRFFSTGIIFTMVFCILFLTQCELFLGNDENANVGIDLSRFYGDAGSRAVTGVPSGITITGVKISVFGPGMTPIQKWVSAGARFVNMSVPAGQDRHFTLEVFFSKNPNSTFLYDDLRSYKGRTIAPDLRPGMYVGLKFQMVAGATALLVPDYYGHMMYSAEIVEDFVEPNTGTLGVASTIYPNDLEIATDGRIFVSNTNVEAINYHNSLNPPASPPPPAPIPMTSAPPTALAMDRDCYININNDPGNIIETNILYISSGNQLYYSILDDSTSLPGQPPPAPQFPVQMTAPGMGAISGMSLDPWTHMLYLVGQRTVGLREYVIVKYDPFIPNGQTYGAIVGQPVQIPEFRTLQDVLAKDDGVYVLNQIDDPADNTTPIILKFDKNLNLIQSFGTISSLNQGGQWQIVPSTVPGKFYHPKRFFAQENEGLYIIDDSDYLYHGPNFTFDYDKLVFINTQLDPASWKTFPNGQTDGADPGEPFIFFDGPPR
ncbi:MAG: hypothetical protein JXD23_03990 [Spirochaetales bacterium]|nr:hypothetical protein [Spirochaetales bacterium]